MLIEIVANSAAPHQVSTARALLRGLQRHNVQARLLNSADRVEGDIVACWGWRQGKLHRAAGRRVLVMERGYVGDRFTWTSLGWDGLNGRARFPRIADGGRRWRRHFNSILQSRRSAGVHVLILGQVTGDASIEGVAIGTWYQSAAKVLFDCSGLSVKFRPHPVEVQRRWGGALPPRVHGLEVARGTLHEALIDAAAAVAWNSNSLVDAALFGVPVLAGDAGSMAWPVAGHGLSESPRLGERANWAHRLAWCQWLEEEIASGASWEAVRTAMDPVRVET